MKRCIVALCLAVCVSSGLVGLDGDTSLLRKSDEAYMPQRSKFSMKIENFEDGKAKTWYRMDCYVDGNERYLLVFGDPAVVRGQTQLRLGGTIYNYVRKVDRVSQVSARLNFQQTTLAQEDIMSAGLGVFYSMESVQEAAEADGRKVLRMILVAKERQVAYAKIEAVVDAGTFMPVRRLYYANSGKLIKEMSFEEVVRDNGRLVRVKFRMIDSLRPQNFSVVEMDGFDTAASMPSSMFTQQYMKSAAR